MPFNLFANILVDAANLIIGIYAYTRNPRHIINRAFLIFVCGIVVWSGSMMLLAFDPQRWLAAAAFFGAEALVLGFVLLAEVFPDRKTARPIVLIYLIPWYAIVLATALGLVIRGATFDRAGYLRPVYGPLFRTYAIVIGLYIAWSVARLIGKYKTLSGVYRVQMRYFATGAGLFLGLAFVTNVLLPAAGVFEFNLVGPLFSIIFIGNTAYAIVRHQFMDVRVVLQRGLLYLLATGMIAVAFFSFNLVIGQFLDFDELGGALAAAIGAFGFMRLKRFFEQISDPFFFRREYHYSDATRELGPLLHATIDLDQLVSSLGAFLSRTIKPSSAVFVLFAEAGGASRLLPSNPDLSKNDINRLACLKEPIFLQERNILPDDSSMDNLLRQNGIHAAIPFYGKNGVMAVMLLGGKKSGDIFRTQDIDLLSVIAHQGGMALENARLYEKERLHAKELERRVSERTCKIKAMQEAQARFLTDVSHELQTPMAVLRGNMEVLEHEHQGGGRKTALSIMGVTIDGMSKMVSELLAVARLNFAKDKLFKTRLRSDLLLEDVFNDCVVLAENKKVAFSYSSDPFYVAGDKDKLKEVLLNLISNALKHTPRGGSIALSGYEAGESVGFVVADSGVGIAPERIRHIFERFYYIEGDEISGNGLGLNICKKIIEAHEGSIRVESELGKGSRFIISLPRIGDTDEIAAGHLSTADAASFNDRSG